MSAPPLLIRGGLVADPESGRVSSLDLLIENKVIARIGPPGSIAEPRIVEHDATSRLIVPGFVNAHTHGHANLAKGVADRWTLEMSLVNGPWMGGARDEETIYVSTLIGAIDMLSKGCTACFDLVYEFPRPTVGGILAAARAYADAGMRAVLAPMVADKSIYHAIPGLIDALPSDLREVVGQFDLGSGEATINALQEIASARSALPEGISLGIAPTIPHHCTERFLTRCVELADRYALPIHMHIAESRLQLVTARSLYVASPVSYLDGLGVLRPGFTAAHCVWLDGDDLDCLAERGCSIAHIPASNLRLGSGTAHVRPMLDRGITVGLATDGANSSDALSMLQAMRLASYCSRTFDEEREAWLSASEAVRMATIGGADLIGLAEGGRIKVGAPADLTFFDTDHIDFVPLNDPFNQLVAAADSASITDVMVAGRFALEGRRVVTVDMTELSERVRAVGARRSAGLGEVRKLAARIEPHVAAYASRFAREPLGLDRFIRPTEGATPKA
jgi:cytosine/adenosine deaminase-related metal-dependent hydrolase